MLTQDEYERALVLIERAMDDLDRAMDLVEEYEEAHFPIPEPSRLSRFLYHLERIFDNIKYWFTRRSDEQEK